MGKGAENVNNIANTMDENKALEQAGDVEKIPVDVENEKAATYDNGPLYPAKVNADGSVEVSGIKVDPNQNFKATEIQMWPIMGDKFIIARPHMRAFHFAWLSFFCAFVVWFAFSPLLVQVRVDLDIPKKGIWLSNICNVGACVFGRFVVGPLGDQYGSVKIQTALMLWCATFTLFAGLVTDLASLCIVRFLIGAGGATFVITQYWSSQMFAKNVVGTSNAITAGWGNLGGGVTIMLVSALYLGFNSAYSPEKSWRLCFLPLAFFVLCVALGMYFFADDSPQGTYDTAIKAGQRKKLTAVDSAKGGFTNINAWLLGIQYATCFGVELHVNNAMAMYFHDDPAFQMSLANSGFIASLFGWMNLFARGLGGAASDYLSKSLGMQGRMIVHTIALLLEGVFLCVFSRMRTLGTAIPCLLCFSLFVQASEGTSYGIVPFIDPKNLGAICAVVGAWGNIGAVCCGFLFMYGEQVYGETGGRGGFYVLGWIIMASSAVSAFIFIPGHGSIWGQATTDGAAKAGAPAAPDASEIEMMCRYGAMPVTEEVEAPKLAADETAAIDV